jgi:hypothetical protein
MCHTSALYTKRLCGRLGPRTDTSDTAGVVQVLMLLVLVVLVLVADTGSIVVLGAGC